MPHTPTPWVSKVHKVAGPDGATVCNVPLPAMGSHQKQAANAAHIVRCVNAHDALVAALTKAVAAMEIGLGNGTTTVRTMALAGGIEVARAALEAARHE